MHDFLVSFGKWLESTPWGTFTRTTLWGYPFVQLTHFSGLSLWLGTTIAVDLRLLGIGKKSATPLQLSNSLFAWNWTGFAIAVLGGFVLFSSTATTYLVNPAFQLKLGILVPLALIWHIVVQRKTRDWGRTEFTPSIAKLAGLFEFVLWICVVTAAVEIPNH
jgi:hypothetical protein